MHAALLPLQAQAAGPPQWGVNHGASMLVDARLGEPSQGGETSTMGEYPWHALVLGM